jgi:hypothetical protein
MYKYYEQQGLLSTFKDLQNLSDLNAYQETRGRLFLEKLLVPPAVFRGAEVLEYGPDTGEDALVFARWGAQLTLVEPNRNAVSTLSKYFEAFQLENHIQNIHVASLEDCDIRDRYDFIDAEGFVYTIKPSDIWLSRFQSQLRPGGFFLISFNEATGFLIEACTRALYRVALEISGKSNFETASALFRAKWESIAHTRPFETWVLDVLQNPFGRMEFTLDAAALVTAAADYGFELYSSWPVYRDPLQVYWHKHHYSPEEVRQQTRDHVLNSQLSFFMGTRAYIMDDDRALLENLKTQFEELGTVLNHSEDAPDAKRIAESLKGLHRVAQRLSVSPATSKDDALALLELLQQAFGCAERRDFEGMFAFTNDEPFVKRWGQPFHLAVFRRSEIQAPS